MEGVFFLDSKSNIVVKDEPKVEKVTKDSIGNSGRKMLSDISNIKRKASTLTQDYKPRANSVTAREYVEKIQKENAALLKLLADKNRIIELSGAELHKLRIALQKMQQNNLQLAQSNSQMLAELNSGKDRLKELQHQLGCKNALLIAKKLESEGKQKSKTCQTVDNKKVKVSGDEETTVVAERDKNPHCNTSGRQKSKSLGPSVRRGQDKPICDNGRVRGRRQSARFRHDEPKPREDVSNTDDDKTQEEDSNPVAFSVKKEGEDDSVVEERISSISRPSRVAAKKVQSYKEMKLNVKMRRLE